MKKIIPFTEAVNEFYRRQLMKATCGHVSGLVLSYSRAYLLCLLNSLSYQERAMIPKALLFGTLVTIDLLLYISALKVLRVKVVKAA